MSPKLPRVGPEKVLRAMVRGGWHEHHRRGSHVYLRHQDKPGKQVTIPVHLGRDLLPATLAAILDQAEMTVEELIELL